jgi:hypothetical protein
MANEFPNDAALTAMAAELASITTHVQVHSGDPGAAGTSNIAAGTSRVAVVWDADADGDLSLQGVELVTGGTPASNATWLSFWSASSGGTHYGNRPTTGDTTFNASGEYEVTEITVTGTTAA